jgi:hypothetical protein
MIRILITVLAVLWLSPSTPAPHALDRTTTISVAAGDRLAVPTVDALAPATVAAVSVFLFAPLLNGAQRDPAAARYSVARLWLRDTRLLC